MRLSEEELRAKEPTYSKNYDIVGIRYGDVPHKIYDENERQWFLKQEGTISNICAVDNYIYTQNGEYSDYRTLIGSVKIDTKGKVLCGSINVKYYGKTYNIYLLNMYGEQGLDILRLRNGVAGWCNKDGLGSPSSKSTTKELDLDIVEKILNLKLEDYGEGIQKFMATCREIHNQDKENYIMEKCFKL